MIKGIMAADKNPTSKGDFAIFKVLDPRWGAENFFFTLGGEHFFSKLGGTRSVLIVTHNGKIRKNVH